MKPSQFFPFMYYQKDKDLKGRPFETQIHKLRDGLAVMELSSAIAPSRYRYGGTLLNPPISIRGAEPIIRDIVPSIKENDLILVATRPPLDDKDGENKRRITCSDTAIEGEIFQAMRGIFAHCDRSDISLHQDLAPRPDLPQTQEFRSIKFKQYAGGTADFLNGRKPADPSFTIGYLVAIPHVPPKNFRLLAAFGPGGTETLWFCHLLRVHFRRLFHAAIRSKTVKLWTVPFLVPAYAPTLLECVTKEIRAKAEFSKPVEWITRDAILRASNP